MICKNKILSKGGKRIFILCIVLIFLLSFLFLFFEFYFEFYQKEKEYSQMLRIENNGERYGQSIFWKYQGKIYALITGEGALPLENVDIESFRIFR